MISDLLKKIFGTQHDRDMKKLQPLVDRVNFLEKEMKNLTTAEFKEKTSQFRQRIDQGESLEEILPEAFAVCREASVRVLGLRHYDVQIIGGIVLHRGNIAEMKTGEGKTLVATLPLYLNGLTQRGAHLVTVNDYLACRDEEWMRPIYHLLGLSTGTITHNISDSERKKAYSSDITYGTNNEFGFDYLRDNMKFNLSDFSQRDFHYAIVDECDSILIDEARTPLIISGPAEESTDKYYEINKIIPHLKKETHFTMEEKTRTVSLTEEGNEKVEKLLGLKNLYDITNIQWLHHVYQGLKALHLFRKDVDYMIKGGEVIIIDEFTGRLMPGRRWSEGIHQAIEAKEGVKVRSENQTLATITFQNYFRMYEKLSGMTGTAETEALEFKKIYDLNVVVIPTHKPIARRDEDDIIYKTEMAKFKAISDDIKERSKLGQPILVGTISIEKSERLSHMLKKEGVSHNVLNAKHHEKEAEIIAQAGRKGFVTIATNMAGRGTDIQLGGNPEALALKEVEKISQKEKASQSQKEKISQREDQGNSLDNDSQSLKKELYEKVFKKHKDFSEANKKEVIQSGGLYIIGTERHESRRIDNQLRGRSGRQGDPGETRFYLSLEDDLMRIFNGERIQKIMSTLRIPDDEPITAGIVTRAIEGAQKKVEGHQFDIRKHLLEYDNVMNQQRQNIYSLRKEILKGTQIDRIMLDKLGAVTSSILDQFANENIPMEKWDFEAIQSTFFQQCGIKFDFNFSSLKANELIEKIRDSVKDAYDEQRKKFGSHFKSMQKFILLQTIDYHWKEHLAFNDNLKEGINLRAYAQKDPLIEYKKEAFQAFEKMNLSVQRESIEKCFKIQLVTQGQDGDDQALEESVSSLNEMNLSYEGGEESDTGHLYEDLVTEMMAKEMRNRAKVLGSNQLDREGKREGEGSGLQEMGNDGQSLRTYPKGEDSHKLNRAERRRLKKEKRRGRHSIS